MINLEGKIRVFVQAFYGVRIRFIRAMLSAGSFIVGNDIPESHFKNFTTLRQIYIIILIKDIAINLPVINKMIENLINFIKIRPYMPFSWQNYELLCQSLFVLQCLTQY